MRFVAVTRRSGAPLVWRTPTLRWKRECAKWPFGLVRSFSRSASSRQPRSANDFHAVVGLTDWMRSGRPWLRPRAAFQGRANERTLGFRNRSLRSEGAGVLSLFVSPADGRFQSRSPGLEKTERDQGIGTKSHSGAPLALTSPCPPEPAAAARSSGSRRSR